MKLPLAVSLGLCLAAADAGSRAWLFDDFESVERVTAHSLAWITLGDELLGGTSTLALEHVPAGPRGTGRALRLRGSVGSTPHAFTGAWAPLDGQGRPADLRAFDALRFRARGEGTFRAGLRCGRGQAMANFMASFTPGREWKAVEIPFDRLSAVGPGSSGAVWTPQEVHWLGITTSPGADGRFLLEIDDVELVSRRAGRPLPIAEPGPARAIRVALAPSPGDGTWRELGVDPGGDGKQPTLPDAVSVSVLADGGREPVWFRIRLQGPHSPPAFGLNVALDLDGDPGNGMPWWGTNTAFRFDRVVTVWLFKTGSVYQGTAGVADPASVARGDFMAEVRDLPVAIDRDPPAFLVGVPRSMFARGDGPVRLLAAVGSALWHNDDVPDTGALSLAR
jgi:hypothetical protein